MNDMPVLDLFSRRKPIDSNETKDILTYDNIPNSLRVQIVHIWKDGFGDHGRYGSPAGEVFEEMHKSLARELGVFRFGGPYDDDFTSLANYFLGTTKVSEALDIIEHTFKMLLICHGSQNYLNHASPNVTARDAIEELNTRFLQHSVGYAFIEESLIRRDREFLHNQVTIPALFLLHEKAFAGANQEFLSAHEHYRKGKYKECLNDCLKSFESTMKVICGKNKWKYSQNDTAKALIEVCLKNDLIPAFLQSEVGALRAALEAGIPTVRNRMSGHGQGETVVEVPAYYASYLLHLTAATVILLIEASKK